jgi:hypothetical protein
MKRVAHYALALAIVSFVLWHTDLAALGNALRSTHLALFASVSAALLILNCAADVFAMQRTFGRFGHYVEYRELFIVKAASYLVAIINYHVGQAAILGYLLKRGVNLKRATGIMLFLMGINVLTLCLLAGVGTAVVPPEAAPIRTMMLLVAAGLLVYCALLALPPRRIRENGVFAPLIEMGFEGHGYAAAVRLWHVAVLVLWHFFSLRMFAIEVPVSAALLFIPAYLAVGALPVSINGFGGAQLAAIVLFERFAPGAQAGDRRAVVMAYSLATAGICLLTQAALGLLFVQKGVTTALQRAQESQ